MNIELSTSTEAAPFDLLDVLVQNRRDRDDDRSLLSLHFLGQRGPQTERLKMPLLTWFDAHQLQSFTRQLANAGNRPDRCEMDLPDAGLRLIATGQNRRSIRVEPMPTASRRFAPVTINGTPSGLRDYAKVLYSRLWEAFCRG
ncbi:hypothetical protein J2I47_05125 [Fibrella sp. HMF5335]|uniref:Uncharacterized protein n=1 Tax=Fibrella rubiginis TaxID=2817060 RepID=A0A939GDS6_9BACT|nr:hypothetical protein [Fibrella rubiginis]MBO0935923.1 hypothetical protein [Fibrella rubiginis]